MLFSIPENARKYTFRKGKAHIVAVICEYNPFHSGHARHLRLTRAAFPEEAVVCVMSGAFTQRGEPAILEKCARAEMAVRNGADLVVELPAAFAVAGARDFASGCVQAAELLGAETLSFGSECGDLALLRRAAAILDDESAFSDSLRAELEKGEGFAAARFHAIQKIDPEAAEILRTPNDILGVEYLRALKVHGMRGFAVKRLGAGHDEPLTETGYPSASALREALKNGKTAWLSEHMPETAFAVLEREITAGRAPVLPEVLESAVFACLRDYAPEDFLRFADFPEGEGLEYRLRDALRENGTLDAVCAAADSKRTPTARIRRAIWRSFLRLPREWSHEVPPFLRVLALNERGAEILKTAKIPILSRSRQAESLDERGKQWFRADERAGDLFALGYPEKTLRVCGNEKRLRPVFVPSLSGSPER